MKLASFKNHDNEIRIGQKMDDNIIDLTAVFEKYLIEEIGVSADNAVEVAYKKMPTSMLELIQREEEGQEDLKKIEEYINKTFSNDFETYNSLGSKLVYNLKEIKLLKPIPQNTTMFNVGVNYPAFLRMKSVIGPEENKTCMFIVPYNSTIGPGEEVILPQSAKEVSNELELGVVIGKRGKRISQDNAHKYIFGYTIINDLTGIDIVRKAQGTGREGLPGAYYMVRSKSFDTFEPFGPYIVTKDEIKDPQDINGELKINGEPKIKGCTGEMRCSINRLFEYLTEDITFNPGNILATGGMGTDEYPPKCYVESGDEIEACLDGLGTLTYSIR